MRRWYDPSLLHEVTMRSVDGMWCFDPEDDELRLAILGTMAAAQTKFPVRIHAFTFMSNHFHAIYSIDGPQQLSGFMAHFHAGVALLVNRRLRRTGPVWGHRPHSVPILPEPAAQLRRLKYVIGQGVRAGVASHPVDWQGVSSTQWLLFGTELSGLHVDRTQRALDNRNRAEPLPESDYAASMAPTLTPLPCFAGMDSTEWRAHVAAIADEISREADGRPALDSPNLGDLDADGMSDPSTGTAGAPDLPKSPPPKRKRSPLVHAGSAASEREYLARRKEFDAAYCDARARQATAAELAARGLAAPFVVFPLWAFPLAPPCWSPSPDRRNDLNYFMG